VWKIVGQEDVDHVGGGRRRDRDHLEALGPRPLGVVVLAVADADLDAGVAQVERGGAAEIAVTEHGHRLAREGAGWRVGRAIYLDVLASRIGHCVILY
jgi:hypothetical protein